MKIEPTGQPSPSSANVLTGPFEARLDQPITLYDVTLREGEQPPGVVFTQDDKLEIARALDEIGIPSLSIGFPAVSEEERRTCRRIADGGFRFKKAVLSRTLRSDIDVSADCGMQLLGLFIGGSDSHLRDKLRITEDQAVERIADSVSYTKERGLEAHFGLEDFSRTPLPRMLRLYQSAVDAGADGLIFPDTAGVLTPTATFRLFSLLKAYFPVPLITHFHNDLGLSLGNTLAALEAGAEGVHTTVNGAGERSGNTCLEEMLVVLKVKYGRDLGLRLDRLYEVSQLVHQASRTEAPAHKPIVGKWCFTHESGIHVAGILANPETYQPYPPALVGRHHEIVFGKHSGAQGVSALAQRAGLELSDAARKTILERIKKEAESRHASVPEDLILDWIRAEQEAPVVVPAVQGG